jgi:high-affinity K+ transport system ATPase subunit B
MKRAVDDKIYYPKKCQILTIVVTGDNKIRTGVMADSVSLSVWPMRCNPRSAYADVQRRLVGIGGI